MPTTPEAPSKLCSSRENDRSLLLVFLSTLGVGDSLLDRLDIRDLVSLLSTCHEALGMSDGNNKWQISPRHLKDISDARFWQPRYILGSACIVSNRVADYLFDHGRASFKHRLKVLCRFGTELKAEMVVNQRLSCPWNLTTTEVIHPLFPDDTCDSSRSNEGERLWKNPWSGEDFDQVKRNLLVKAARAAASNNRLCLLKRIYTILHRYSLLMQPEVHDSYVRDFLYKVARTGNRDAVQFALSQVAHDSCEKCLADVYSGYRSFQIYTTGYEDESQISPWLKEDKRRVFRHSLRCAVRTCNTKEEFTESFKEALKLIFSNNKHPYETRFRKRRLSEEKESSLQRTKTDFLVFILREIQPVACKRFHVLGFPESLTESLVSDLDAPRELCETLCGLWKALPVESAKEIRERLLQMLQKFPARNQLLHRFISHCVARLLSSCRLDLLAMISEHEDSVKDLVWTCCYDEEETFEEDVASTGFIEWIQHQRETAQQSTISQQP